MNYEEKMRALANCKPEKKDLLLAKLVRGEKIDITKDEDLFYQVNKDRVTLETFVNRDKFKRDALEMKWLKQNLDDPRHGTSKSKRVRWLGDIPAEIYFSRKEFSDPNIPRDERLRNIKNFLNQFPVFKAVDGTV